MFVHGTVGSAKERCTVISRSSPSQADAGGGLPVPAGELDGSSEHAFDARGNAALCPGSDVAAEDHELIAAEPRHIVSWPQRAPEASRNDAQHLVAGVMTESVVHRLESIEIDERDDDIGAALRQRAVNRMFDGASIDETGEIVVLGEVTQLRGGVTSVIDR